MNHKLAPKEIPTESVGAENALIALRRANPALRNGPLVVADDADPDVVTFERRVSGKPGVRIVLNLSAEAKRLEGGARELLSSGAHLIGARLVLDPYGVFIGETR